MVKPRSAQISRSETSYYHCVSRCVRRAFLCGIDHETGISYEHRRGWIQERIRLLSSLFTIDMCAYAVMSNHYHLVVKLGSSEYLTDEDVLQRWLVLFKGPALVQAYRAGNPLSPTQWATVKDIIQVWRTRLQDLSWFMKCLNEPVARQANREDTCTGHFWESRFKTQALKTQEALLSCMAYVDLNPVRAGIAHTLEQSDYTSVQERIVRPFNPKITEALRDAHGLQPREQPMMLKPLLHFDTPGRAEHKSGIPFRLEDYLVLLGWTGRMVREDGRGRIEATTPPILSRLAIAPDQWLMSYN